MREEGAELQLSVGTMGLTLFDGPKVLESVLYASLQGGWHLDKHAPSTPLGKHKKGASSPGATGAAAQGDGQACELLLMRKVAPSSPCTYHLPSPPFTQPPRVLMQHTYRVYLSAHASTNLHRIC